MKKTTCKICGMPAMPLYLRVPHIDTGKLIYSRFGTFCQNPDCACIETDQGDYQLIHYEPVQETERERRTRLIKEVLKEMADSGELQQICKGE